ncbi:hypothetical protein EVAR_4093_1 [Eumeta japonica]|uniref:Uncharacterized protein n=1 Tax=Eumeta variegata TaxID=151549 RepID=A0A4C1T405_EUMVA|nr:hypothetical protein EVAR_4093_1 [Eumeta japonica]
MNCKLVTRARKMNTVEQENETPVSPPTSRLSKTDKSCTSLTHTWDHDTNENLSESSCGRERIDEELGNLQADTRSDRVDVPSVGSVPVATHGLLATNMRNRSPTPAQAAAAHTKILRLDVDEENTGDLIECQNKFHLSKIDILEKRTVISEMSPHTESSSTSAPPPLPAACGETNSASPRMCMSEWTLADAIIFAIKLASKEMSRVIGEPSKTLTDLRTFSGSVSEQIAFRAVYNDMSGLFSDV